MRRTWLYIVLLFCLVGCTTHSAEQGTVPEGNSYATGFQITPTDSGTIVEVFQPYQRMVITEPMHRIGTMSTVQVGFLYALDAIDHLAAVCNPELIYTPIKGSEIDLGDSMKPSAERVLQAGLDVLLAVNYGQYDNLEAARLEKLGVPIIYINEWQEGSPLARAEWIRVIGALTGKLHEADSIFAEDIPWHSGSAVVGLDWESKRGDHYGFNYSFIYVGERYCQQENTIYNYVQPWYTHDLSLYGEWLIKGERLKVKGERLWLKANVEINNLLGQDYEVIQNYPMPKQNVRCTLAVRY